MGIWKILWHFHNPQYNTKIWLYETDADFGDQSIFIFIFENLTIFIAMNNYSPPLHQGSESQEWLLSQRAGAGSSQLVPRLTWLWLKIKSSFKIIFRDEGLSRIKHTLFILEGGDVFNRFLMLWNEFCMIQEILKSFFHGKFQGCILLLTEIFCNVIYLFIYFH